MKRALALILVAILAFVCGVFVTILLPTQVKQILPFARYEVEADKVEEAELTAETINQKIMNIGEMATAQLDYTGLVTHAEGSIPFITKNGYSMMYTAEVKAGIGVEDLTENIDITEDTVTITLPRSKILSISIPEDSLQFLDEKNSLTSVLNKDEHENVKESLAAAKADCKKNANMAGLKKTANKNAKTLVEELLKDVIGDRELVVVFE